jgi:hypothetical protein
MLVGMSNSTGTSISISAFPVVAHNPAFINRSYLPYSEPYINPRLTAKVHSTFTSTFSLNHPLTSISFLNYYYEGDEEVCHEVCYKTWLT